WFEVLSCSCLLQLIFGPPERFRIGGSMPHHPQRFSRDPAQPSAILREKLAAFHGTPLASRRRHAGKP
ncbi:MAG TPA: hypothetical protein VK775_20650, partial [Chthoniobacterales bacterium]|nr:hypothetical protein [Chthoniobacterales bacterium]